MRTDVKEAQPACRKHKMIKRMLCRKVYPYLYGAMLYCVAARVACPPSPAPTDHPRRTTLNQNAKRNIPVAADAKDTACPATRLRRLACMPRASQRGSELWLQSDCIKRRAINNNIGTTRTIKPTTQHASLTHRQSTPRHTKSRTPQPATNAAAQRNIDAPLARLTRVRRGKSPSYHLSTGVAGRQSVHQPSQQANGTRRINNPWPRLMPTTHTNTRKHWRSLTAHRTTRSTGHNI